MSPEKKPLDAVPAENPDEAKTPAQIRAEIDQTREGLGDTVEALAEKTDVKAQAKAKVDDVREKVRVAAPESPQEGVQQAQALVRQNPKPAAIAGTALVLFVLWRLLRR
jgi:ElaB/YqjD/DUF883 family membrane-anchored ribosome-binding protein